jgi:hypothetical protein
MYQANRRAQRSDELLFEYLGHLDPKTRGSLQGKPRCDFDLLKSNWLGKQSREEREAILIRLAKNTVPTSLSQI